MPGVRADYPQLDEVAGLPPEDACGGAHHCGQCVTGVGPGDSSEHLAHNLLVPAEPGAGLGHHLGARDYPLHAKDEQVHALGEHEAVIPQGTEGSSLSTGSIIGRYKKSRF